MLNLIEKLANLLGYYQLQEHEFYQYYGSAYYVPNTVQLAQQVETQDEILRDVAELQIAQEINRRIDNGLKPDFQFDFKPIVGLVPKIQQDRVMHNVLKRLEDKGYRVVNQSFESSFAVPNPIDTEPTDPDDRFKTTIKWNVGFPFRQFRRRRRGNIPI